MTDHLTEVFVNVHANKWPHLLVVAVCFIASHVRAQSVAHFSSQDFKTKSVFELLINDRVPSSRAIVTQSALITPARGLIPGNSDGLEIQFFTKPITEAVMTDILKNGAKEKSCGCLGTWILSSRVSFG
jgi:hypothetical protein